MGQTELKVFIVLATLILLVFIIGILVFILQYHKRKLVYEREKAVINQVHVQELLEAKLEMQQRTMQDIGREIHDNVGQKLTLASLYANQLDHDQRDQQIKEPVGMIAKIISESLDDLRNLSQSLANPDVETSDLKQLLQKECVRVRGLGICATECTFNEPIPPISTTRKYFILRIVQEFMQNSLKHAECSSISLRIEGNEKGLAVRMADDGIGFDSGAEQARPDKGIGLANIRKRAELIGGELTFSSRIGYGTSMLLIIPTEKIAT